MAERARDEINALKDEIRDLKINFVKKDDVEYRRNSEQTLKNSKELAEIRATTRSTNSLLEKNNTLTESLNVSNARLTAILESITEKVDATMSNVKDLSVKVSRIDLEASKNTDNRLTGKQIAVSLAIAILMLFIGAGLSQSGLK